MPGDPIIGLGFVMHAEEEDFYVILHSSAPTKNFNGYMLSLVFGFFPPLGHSCISEVFHSTVYSLVFILKYTIYRTVHIDSCLAF